MKYIFSGALIIAVTLIAYSIYEDVRHPWECVEQHKVAKILALRYRDGVIELDNGKQMTVDQATLQPGDYVCTRRAQK